MTTGGTNYGLFLKFFHAYAPVGFKGIDPADPLVVELEQMMEQNDQFFYIGDLASIEILYVSQRSAHMMGIKPEDLRLNNFIDATHPDDLKRAGLGRIRIFKMAHNVSVAKGGASLLSTNCRIRNAEGSYSNMLMQLYMFYSKLPYESTFLVKVHTNIDWCGRLKKGYHYYTGDDLSWFRYPDEELLMTGLPYSQREFEIITLIVSGLNSEQIAKKLYLSLDTVHTHRRNILKKSDKATMADVIFDLIERGIL